MNNANIRRYERELTGNLRGARLRKRVSAAFAQSLPPCWRRFPTPAMRIWRMPLVRRSSLPSPCCKP